MTGIRIEGKLSKTLSSHSDEVNEVFFHPDGRLASCSDDNTIKVWDTASEQELYELSAHTDWVISLAMLPNGWLASGSRDTTIKLWDLKERKEMKTLEGHTKGIFSLKVLSNGNLVSASWDDTIKIWNPLSEDNKPLLTIEGHGNKGWMIPIGVLSNDFLVACSRDKENKEDSTLRVWDSKDGRLVKSLPTGLNAVKTLLVLSNDQVAIGTEVKGLATIRIIDLDDDSKTRMIEKAYETEVSRLLQLSNGNLVSSGTDGSWPSQVHSIKVWQFSDLSLLQRIETDDSSDWINSLSVSLDGTTLACGTFGSTIKLWPLSSIKDEAPRSS